MTGKHDKYLDTIVYLHWVDSSLYGGNVWERHELGGVMENQSAGLLVSEDDQQITLALDHCPETQGFRCLLVVPKFAIQHERRFSFAGKAATEKSSKRKRESSS